MKDKTVISIYEDISDWYDSARTKILQEKEWLDFALSKLPQNAEILDLGCGTGEPIAKYLIEAGCRLTGIDGSKNMIAQCTKKFPHHNWAVQDMRSFEAGQTFDAIIAWDSFFHLSGNDQRSMFAILAKHCRSNGLLIFSSGTNETESWSPMLGHDSAQMFHASLDTEEYRLLLEQHGFSVLKHVESDPNCGGHTYWISVAKEIIG